MSSKYDCVLDTYMFMLGSFKNAYKSWVIYYGDPWWKWQGPKGQVLVNFGQVLGKFQEYIGQILGKFQASLEIAPKLPKTCPKYSYNEGVIFHVCDIT